MSKQKLIDTNVLIRFLTNDHPIHSPKAFALIKQAVDGEVILYLDPLVVAESVWVLSKVYEFSRNDISDKLTKLVEFEGFHSPEKDVILLALGMYALKNVDYADAYLAAKAETLRDTVVITFNTKDFNRLGVDNQEPGVPNGSEEED